MKVLTLQRMYLEKRKKLWFSSPFPTFCFRGRFLSSIKIWEIWRGGGGGEEEGESWQEAIGGDVSGEGEDEEGTVWNSPLNKIKTTKINTRYIIENKKIYPQKHQGLTHTLFFCLFGKSLRSVPPPPPVLLPRPLISGRGGKRHGSGFRRRGRGKEN